MLVENFLLFLELLFLCLFFNMYTLYKKMYKKTLNKEKIEYLVRSRLALVGIIIFTVFILYDIFFDIKYPNLGVGSGIIFNIITIIMGKLIYRFLLWIELSREDKKDR